MDVEMELRYCVESFVSDLDVLMRRAAIAAVEETFAGGAPMRTTRGSGAKRTPAELDQLQEQLLETITLSPGLRVEALSEVMQVPSRDLTLPIKKLIGLRKIRKKGQKRATSYFLK